MNDHIAAMRQAREALGNSVDYVWQAYHGQKAMWANLPTRAAQLDGLHQLAKDHDAAIAALDAALAKVQDPVAVPSLEVDGPQFDEHFKQNIDTYADKHPTLVVRQLARRLRRFYAAPPAPAATVHEPVAVSTWWTLVMGAAASIEDAANGLSDADAKRAADGAAKHYRERANALYTAPPAPVAAVLEGDRDAFIKGILKGQQ